MGYLHRGHQELVEKAVAENDFVVVSVYVNPSQFGPAEDFERYPRDTRRDLALISDWGGNAAFVPSDEDMYPGGLAGQKVWIDPGELAAHLCGASRPGHFRGVATVVAKLFDIAQPDRAYFGQKDAQQVVIVRRMARDLAMPVEVRIVPTVRETDGLALSSRNAYLTTEERRQAPGLKAALDRAQVAYTSGERRAEELRRTMRTDIAERAPLGRMDYVDIVDLGTLAPISGTIQSDALAAVAAYFGSTRLIDNVILADSPGALERRT
jgi:pantoate--beta-alanine ligase